MPCACDVTPRDTRSRHLPQSREIRSSHSSAVAALMSTVAVGRDGYGLYSIIDKLLVGAGPLLDIIVPWSSSIYL